MDSQEVAEVYNMGVKMYKRGRRKGFLYGVAFIIMLIVLIMFSVRLAHWLDPGVVEQGPRSFEVE